jgi:hypothetical protein
LPVVCGMLTGGQVLSHMRKSHAATSSDWRLHLCSKSVFSKTGVFT